MAHPHQLHVRVIASDRDVRDGVKALRRKCALIRKIHDAAGDPPLRLRQPGFEGLARIVVSQQLSVASAAAIWTRFAACVLPLDAKSVLQMPDEALRTAGLSRAKIKALRAIATAVVHDGLMLDGFNSHSEEAVHESLTRVPGIGPWTADVFLMFCMGRADAFAAGDLALQEAVRIAFELEIRPTQVQLLEIAERWRPWRSVAARLLWAYYKTVKSREGVAE